MIAFVAFSPLSNCKRVPEEYRFKNGNWILVIGPRY
ncbi:unnamed protein product [Larinioides sclopetarius]|uniref:Uncharacterized protein n=1 Tax=Larinioides sclopetarius TaxID=280406 RepID=A0AAV1YT87_9ARAC